MDDMSIGGVSLGIGVDFGDLYSQFGDALRYAQSAGEGVGTGFATNFRRGIVGVISDIRSVRYEVGMIGKELAADSGVNIAAQYQTLQVGLEGLLGSGDKARSLLKELSVLGANTPFDTAGLAKYTRMLLAMGYSADGIIDKVKVMTDTIAGLGLGTEAVGRLALVMGQIRSGGLTGNNPRQLQELGINIKDVVGSATGKQFSSQDDARKYLNSQGSEQAADILLQGLQKRFGGSAERIGTGTFTGITQNLKESTQLLMKPTGDLLLGVLQPAASGLRWVADGLGKINEATGGGAGLVGLLGFAVIGFRRISGVVVTTIGVVNRSVGAVERLTLAIEGLGAASNSTSALAKRQPGASGGGVGAIGWGGLAETAISTGVPLGFSSYANYLADQKAKNAAQGASGDKDRIEAERLRGGGSGAAIWGPILGLVGGVIGSAIPGFGTIAGAAAGTGLGTILGAAIGGNVAEGNAKDELRKTRAQENATTALEKNTDALNKISFSSFGGGDRLRGSLRSLEMEYTVARSLRTQLG